MARKSFPLLRFLTKEKGASIIARMPAEELRQQLEKEAKRRLEEHLDQLRLEFERMRLESHRKWEEFLMRLDFPLPELISPGSIPEPPPPAPPPPAAAASADLGSFRDAVRSIDEAENQVDALKAFLSACVRRGDRAVLLVSRGEALAVWKAEGFSPAEDTALRSVSISAASHPAIAAALGGVPVTLARASDLARVLSISAGDRALLCPIVVREKISALLYADRETSSGAFDPDAISLLCFLIGAAVDRLATRKIRPAPALKPIERFAVPEAASAELDLAPVAEVEPEIEHAEAPEPEPAEPEVPDYRAAHEMESPGALEVEEAPEEPEPEPEPPPPPPTRGIDFDSTGHPYRPPPGIQPGGPRILRGPLAAVEEDPHEHAKKIARLLVSDIRLYNEAAIEEGKRHNDIYVRLKDDIDRARQTYNDRVPESVRAGTNYFHEELIRSLANGSSDALGS